MTYYRMYYNQKYNTSYIFLLNGGIYPSQLPTVKLEDIGDVEIIDKRGNKLC